MQGANPFTCRQHGKPYMNLTLRDMKKGDLAIPFIRRRPTGVGLNHPGQDMHG